MPALWKYRNFFNQTDEEKLVLYKEQKSTLVEQDSHIADFLGCKDVLFIAALCEVVERYNWA